MKTLHKIFIGTGLATCVLGVGFAVSYGAYQDKVPQVAKAVSYDDDSYEIELSANELNNYTWTNLTQYLDTIPESVYFITSWSYNNITVSSSEGCAPNANQTWYIRLMQSPNQIFYNVYYGVNTIGVENKFTYRVLDNALDEYVDSTFEYDLTLGISSEYYSNIKNAIELDIQSNAPSQYTYLDFLAESIGLLVGAIVPTASGIGGGLSTLVNALVISNNGMSPFAAIIFTFGGIALALGLSRWVVNLISSLGQRNR